jgi:hypothetical protein
MKIDINKKIDSIEYYKKQNIMKELVEMDKQKKLKPIEKIDYLLKYKCLDNEWEEVSLDGFNEYMEFACPYINIVKVLDNSGADTYIDEFTDDGVILADRDLLFITDDDVFMDSYDIETRFDLKTKRMISKNVIEKKNLSKEDIAIKLGISYEIFK